MTVTTKAVHKRDGEGRFRESLSALNHVVLRSLSLGGDGGGAARTAESIHKGGKRERSEVKCSVVTLGK